MTSVQRQARLSGAVRNVMTSAAAASVRLPRGWIEMAVDEATRVTVTDRLVDVAIDAVAGRAQVAGPNGRNAVAVMLRAALVEAGFEVTS